MKPELIAHMAAAIAKRMEFDYELKTAGKAWIVIPLEIDGKNHEITVHFTRKNL
jgi:hypothetical protein